MAMLNNQMVYSLNARGMSITKSLYQIGMRCLKQMRLQNTTNTNSHRAFSQLKKSILAARWGWLTTYVLGQGVGKEKINKIMYIYIYMHICLDILSIPFVIEQVATV